VLGTFSEPDTLRGLLGHFETPVVVNAQLCPEVCTFLITPSDTLFIRTLFRYRVEQYQLFAIKDDNIVHDVSDVGVRHCIRYLICFSLENSSPLFRSQETRL